MYVMCGAIGLPLVLRLYLSVILAGLSESAYSETVSKCPGPLTGGASRDITLFVSTRRHGKEQK